MDRDNLNTEFIEYLNTFSDNLGKIHVFNAIILPAEKAYNKNFENISQTEWQMFLERQSVITAPILTHFKQTSLEYLSFLKERDSSFITSTPKFMNIKYAQLKTSSKYARLYFKDENEFVEYMKIIHSMKLTMREELVIATKNYMWLSYYDLGANDCINIKLSDIDMEKCTLNIKVNGDIKQIKYNPFFNELILQLSDIGNYLYLLEPLIIPNKSSLKTSNYLILNQFNEEMKMINIVSPYYAKHFTARHIMASGRYYRLLEYFIDNNIIPKTLSQIVEDYKDFNISTVNMAIEFMKFVEHFNPEVAKIFNESFEKNRHEIYSSNIKRWRNNKLNNSEL